MLEIENSKNFHLLCFRSAKFGPGIAIVSLIEVEWLGKWINSFFSIATNTTASSNKLVGSWCCFSRK